MKALLTVPFAILFLLAGCKTLEQNQASTKLVITYSVAKYVEKAGDTDAQAVRAARVRQVAEQALALSDGQDVILAAVEAAVRAEVAKLNLSRADMMLADGLIAVISEEISKRVGDGVLSPEQLIQTRLVLSWIVEATAYASPTV